jgi:glucoamylase
MERDAQWSEGNWGARAGEPTFSATPLAWTHAGFIRLARGIDAGRPVDTPNVVACRYATSLCQP